MHEDSDIAETVAAWLYRFGLYTLATLGACFVVLMAVG